MRDNIFETVVGAAVLLLAGGFLVFALNATGASLERGAYRVEATFTSAGGLSVGSDVKVSGIKVGSISAMRVDPTSYRAVVDLTIDRAITLPDDTAARVAIDSLLDAPYIALDPGGSEDVLADGSEIPIYQTQGTVDLIGLISRAMFSGGGSSEE